SVSRSLHTNRDLEKLEPYEGKPSCTVLRGEEGSNALDLPDRPADLEQRNGRAVRKGNTVKLWGNNTVDIIIYGTEKTLDAYKFNLLKNKQMFINQINNGTVAVRKIDEDSMDENSGMNFAEFVALLSGNTDLLNKTKLDNKIMQLEKEQAIFNKERYRAERKIAQNLQEIEKSEENKRRMSEDWRYITEYKEVREVSIIGMQQATLKEIGQELHIIAKRYRGEDWKTIGHYMNLNLSVRSEYNLCGSFDRNTFYVEGVSGLKYKCGLSGALPLSFTESADYPKVTLEKMPTLISSQQKQIDRLRNEIPTLQQIVARQWNKSEELSTLKQECSELQNRIDESLKQADQQPTPAVDDAA
ncbi:DNA methylase, partial [Bacteroides acidifaciens]|nr:DNA methylase [Bacteroides acidifaciens]